MIFIRFSDVASSPIEITGEIPFLDILKSLNSDEFVFESDQKFKIKASSIPNGAELRGEIFLSFRQLCGRCGELKDRQFSIPIHTVLRRKPPRKYREDDGRYEDDIGVCFVEGERVDLEPILIEQIILTISQVWSEETCRDLPSSINS